MLVALARLVWIPVGMRQAGIDYGPNIGADIIHSGIAAGARKEALMATSGAAVSPVGGGHVPDSVPAPLNQSRKEAYHAKSVRWTCHKAPRWIGG